MTWQREADRRLGEVIRKELEREANRMVGDDGDRESLEALDAEDAVAVQWDEGWAWDTLAEHLIEALADARDGRLESLADHAVEDAELRRQLGVRR